MAKDRIQKETLFKIGVLFLVVIFLAGILAGYKYWVEKRQLSDWNVYKNEEYGFEIEYPSKLIVRDWASKTQNWKILIYFGENKKIGDGPVNIGIEKGINNIGKMCQASLAPKIQISELENAFIGKENYPAKKFSYKGHLHNLLPEEYCGQKEELPNEELDFVRYFIEHGGTLYQIHYTKLIDGKIKLEEAVFKKMLSSFRFLE